MFPKKIILDHTLVTGDPLQDYPVYLHIASPDLKVVDAGGRLHANDGSELFFTLADQRDRLLHTLSRYDPDQGELEAWVRIPALTSRADTVLALHLADHPLSTFGEQVWPRDCLFVLHALGQPGWNEEVRLGPTGEIAETLSVEAWVYSPSPQIETLQSVVSQWAPRSGMDSWEAFDASATDGLRCAAYFGAVFDGRYVYFSPQHYEDRAAHGIVLRYDTQAPFKEGTSYAAFDAGHIDGLNTKGYYGAAFDGRYIYFVPRQDEAGYHSRVLRYDTQADFYQPASWAAYDAGEVHSQQGAIFDGRYLYFCPGYSGDPLREDTFSARVIRFDTRGDFKNGDSWQTFDASRVPGLAAGNFDGGAFDGRYAYFVPLSNGVILRYDTHGEFGDQRSWSAVDGRPFGVHMSVGAVFDGRYLYLVPYAHGRVVRYDTHDDFALATSWSSFDANPTDGLDTGGFDGGFFDGRFVYFVPFISRPSSDKRPKFHSNILRYNTLLPFDQPEAWTARDASGTDGLRSVGYNAGAFDGRYFYMAPWRDGTGSGGMHGRVLRYDTLGAEGAFSLRYSDYGHNGGLCASILGPGFLINAAAGVASVHVYQPLAAGWHYLVGVYTGTRLQLFVDGELAAERSASGQIRACAANLAVGRLTNGGGHFSGSIREVRVWSTALSAGWIRTAYHNLSQPDQFARMVGNG